MWPFRFFDQHKNTLVKNLIILMSFYGNVTLNSLKRIAVVFWRRYLHCCTLAPLISTFISVQRDLCVLKMSNMCATFYSLFLQVEFTNYFSTEQLTIQTIWKKWDWWIKIVCLHLWIELYFLIFPPHKHCSGLQKNEIVGGALMVITINRK